MMVVSSNNIRLQNMSCNLRRAQLLVLRSACISKHARLIMIIVYPPVCRHLLVLVKSTILKKSCDLYQPCDLAVLARSNNPQMTKNELTIIFGSNTYC